MVQQRRDHICVVLFLLLLFLLITSMMNKNVVPRKDEVIKWFNSGETTFVFLLLLFCFCWRQVWWKSWCQGKDEVVSEWEAWTGTNGSKARPRFSAVYSKYWFSFRPFGKNSHITLFSKMRASLIETRGLTFRIIACQLVMPHPRPEFPVHKRYNQKILEFSRAFNLKFNLWCLIATLPDPSFQCTKECIRHSLIIGREGLILTLSILPCPQGRISWSTPCKRVHPRENSWALGMDFPIPRFGGARIQSSNFGIYLCRSRHFHPYTLIIAGRREHWQCMKLDRNVKDP